MKNYFKKTILVLLSALVFAGCASLPDPKSSESCLLYGAAEYRGSYQYGGNSEPEVTVYKSGVKVSVKNLDTRKTYTAESNRYGELIFLGITPGTYSVSKIACKYEYADSVWNVDVKYDTSVSDYQFEVKPGITNLGTVKINANFDGKSEIFLFDNYEAVVDSFFKHHSDSGWAEVEWN